MKRIISLAVTFLYPFLSFSQGKVVINEFMPWPSNGCGVTSEFIELMNFGPGPMNIGCYILTDGDFSITIPPNTVLQPGAFYVIAGQNAIAATCANIDSATTTNLNWNTCNCTSGTIPSTGDGLFTDGGMASEQVVLLSPSLTVVDAVVRTLPVETSSLITTSSVGGQCTPHTFDLDLLLINYETIGESAGRGNSFARKLDGDCGWVKDPQQSAHATNNTPSDVSDVDYDFGVTNTSACTGDGSIAIIVNASNLGNIFPMYYTLAYDRDADDLFELTDSFSTGIVINPNSILMNNFNPGNYRITVESAQGCFLHTFPFVILDCMPVLSRPGRPVSNTTGTIVTRLWPNPARDRISISLAGYERRSQVVLFSIFNSMNQLAGTGERTLDGAGQLSLPVGHLPAGFYQLLIQRKGPGQELSPVYLRFMKL